MPGLWASNIVCATLLVAPPIGPQDSESAESAEPTAEVEASEPVAEPTPQSLPASDPAPAPARLRGRILTFGGGQPIAGARVIFTDGRDSAVADDAGVFSVDLPPGKYDVIVRAPGFEDLKSRVSLSPDQDLQMEYFLDKTLEGRRYRTVVTEEREKAISSTTLSDAEMREVPGTQGDPLRVVSSLPGVAQLAGFLPYVVVRGAAPGNTGYYLDGTRVPVLFHVAIGPSVIHPYFIDEVSFYPAGPPARLGRYISGVIEVRTRPARRDRVHGEVELRLTDAGALLEVPISRPVLPGCTKRRRDCDKGDPRGALTLAGRYSYTAAILSAVQSEAEIQFWDYQARLDHRLGRWADYTAFAYGSFDDVGFNDDETGEKATLVRFHFHRFDNRVRQRLPGGATGLYALVLGLDQTGFGATETDAWRIAPRLQFAVPTPRDNITLGFGLDQEFQIFRLSDEPSELGEDFELQDLSFLFGDRFVNATGLWFEAIIEKGKVQVRPGIRTDIYAQVGASPYLVDAQSITHAVGVDPRVSLRERLNDRWTLKQTAGLYHQPPSFPIPVPAIESFGFERGLQRNLQASAGYELQILEGRLQLSQEAYVSWLTNLQDYELGEASDEDPINEVEDVISQVTGWAYGLETMLKLDPNLRMFGWVAYTLSRATREFPLGGHAPSNWDQRHIVNAVLGYRISHKWNVGGRVHYHTGRPWTAPEEGQTTLDALVTNRNNARLPPFFQLDLRVERIWRFPRWQLSAMLDVVNATYSREVFRCNSDDDPEGGILARAAKLGAVVNPARGLARCTPLGFRYVIPQLGLRARW